MQFRRPGGPLVHPNAITVDRARALLELPHGANATEREADALGRLDGLAGQFRWRPVRPDGPAMRFACAFAETDPPRRLRSIVCRAYALANAYVTEQTRALVDQDACATTRADLARCLDLLCGPIAGIAASHIVNLKKGDPPLARAMDAVARFRRLGEDGEAADDGRRAIEDAVEALGSLLPQLVAVEVAMSPTGAPADNGRFIFALRLAEMLSGTTTVAVNFDQGKKPTDPTTHPTRKFNRARAGNEWQDLLEAALDVTGLSRPGEGTSGLMLRLRKGRGGNAIPHALKNLARSDGVVEGDLPSSGYLADHGIGSPARWTWTAPGEDALGGR